MAKKYDPIRNNHYPSLVIFEKFQSGFFWISVLLPLVANFEFIDSKSSNIISILFPIFVCLYWITGILIRLSLSPRSNESRYKDSLAHIFNIGTPEKTKNYYNNNVSDEFQKIGAQVLESSLYSKNTLSKMLIIERGKIFILGIVWFLLVINRDTGLNLIGIVTQILFSELIITKWLLMEWLNKKFNIIYCSLYDLFSRSRDSTASFKITVLEIMGDYEMSKSNANILLSEKFFNKTKVESDKEWKRVRKELEI